MNNPEILTKIKVLLGMEKEAVALSQMKLEDGLTIVESENFAEGDEVVIITEDGKVALPVGDYTLEDGKLLVVKEDGLIAEVKEKEKEEEKEEVTEEVTEEVEATEEIKEPKKVVKSVSEEIYFTKVDELQKEIETLKKENEELKLSIEKNTPNIKDEEKKTDLSEEDNKAKDVKPILHNPENKKDVQGFKFAQNRNTTTLDRVMEKLSK